VAEPRLHLDADASIKALHHALVVRGHDVTRTPTEWMPLDATDEAQLLGATAHGRSVFTFNIRDFLALDARFPNHAGIILAAQTSWTLPTLIRALDRMLTETDAAMLVGAACWLNRWREA